MLGATELHLAPFPSLCIFLHALLVLVVEARLTCVCSSGGNSTVIHIEGSNLCWEFLVLQSQCVHLFVMMNLLFIKEPSALCIGRPGNEKRGECTKSEVKPNCATCNVAQCKVSPRTSDSNLAHASFDLAQQTILQN